MIDAINHKFNELLLFPNTISEIPINPEKVPKINLKFTFMSLNVHTSKRVKTGTLETIKVKIPASILGATKNSTERGIMQAKVPAIIKNNNFLYVNLNNLLESFNIQKNKMHKINNSGIKIENVMQELKKRQNGIRQK